MPSISFYFISIILITCNLIIVNGSSHTIIGENNIDNVNCAFDSTKNIAIRCCNDNAHWLSVGARSNLGVKPDECASNSVRNGTGWTSNVGSTTGVRCCDHSTGDVIGSSPNCTWIAKNYTEAKYLCKSVGLELCTRNEIIAETGKGTGCSHDSRHLWTSTPCINMTYNNVTCEPIGNWSTANDLCVSEGGRLCTSREIYDGAAIATGCDSNYIWASRQCYYHDSWNCSTLNGWRLTHVDLVTVEEASNCDGGVCIKITGDKDSSGFERVWIERDLDFTELQYATIAYQGKTNSFDTEEERAFTEWFCDGNTTELHVKYYNKGLMSATLFMDYVEIVGCRSYVTFRLGGDVTGSADHILLHEINIYSEYTQSPTFTPSIAPSISPTITPSFNPSYSPTILPSRFPTFSPSFIPSQPPSIVPSQPPSMIPSNIPSVSPTISPTIFPSYQPTFNPTTSNPTYLPTNNPTENIGEVTDSDKSETSVATVIDNTSVDDELHSNDDIMHNIIIYAVIGGSIVLLCCIVIICICMKRRKAKQTTNAVTLAKFKLEDMVRVASETIEMRVNTPDGEQFENKLVNNDTRNRNDSDSMYGPSTDDKVTKGAIDNNHNQENIDTPKGDHITIGGITSGIDPNVVIAVDTSGGVL